MNDLVTNEDLEASTVKWMWAGAIIMGLLIVAFPLYRLYEPSGRTDAREVQAAFLADLGGEIFNGQCAGCHGQEGRGGLGSAIGSKDFLEAVDDSQISQLIALGVPGTEMVAYSSDNGGPLTSTQIESVATYLRSLEPDAVANPQWQKPLADANLSGQDLYGLACSRCHGVDRSGIEDLGPDISLTSFAMDESDEWIAGRIRDGRDIMPRFGGVLSDNQIAQLITYLRGGVASTTTSTTVSAAGGTTTTVSAGGGTTTTTQPGEGDAAILALGKEVFNVTAGGSGCQKCHGLDGQGTKDGPNIVGSSKSAISNAMTGALPMADVKLTSDELEAVYRYLVTLSS
jgi:mono/diheme cytochrome c family protein